jgi:hypothetical protein
MRSADVSDPETVILARIYHDVAGARARSHTSLGATPQTLYYNSLRGWKLPPEARAGMKWFRSNIRLGSRLALCALAIQFLLSFGHFHGGGAQAASATADMHQSVGFAAMPLVASEQTSRPIASGPVRSRTSFSHEPTGQPDDNCAICAVMALANTMLDAAPPYLLAPQAAAFAFLAVDAGFADLNSAPGAFQPRGPPIA